MILETTNPKYFRPPQVPAVRKVINRVIEFDDSLGAGAWSRDVSAGRVVAHEPEHEPESRIAVPKSSIFIMDERHDAPVWLILDRITGVTFARVRGSLPWIVSQMQMLATQLGGLESDLYYQMQGGSDDVEHV